MHKLAKVAILFAALGIVAACSSQQEEVIVPAPVVEEPVSTKY